jgi:hypothetical protein
MYDSAGNCAANGRGRIGTPREIAPPVGEGISYL